MLQQNSVVHHIRLLVVDSSDHLAHSYLHRLKCPYWVSVGYGIQRVHATREPKVPRAKDIPVRIYHYYLEGWHKKRWPPLDQYLCGGFGGASVFDHAVTVPISNEYCRYCSIFLERSFIGTPAPRIGTPYSERCRVPQVGRKFGRDGDLLPTNLACRATRRAS